MKPVLELHDLHFAYARQPVLHGIDLQICRGEFVALIGANGSGKTTLLQCMTGLLPVPGGAVKIDGVDIAQAAVLAKSRLGAAVEPGLLPPLLSGHECLRLFAAARGLPAVPERALALAEELRLSPMLGRSIAEYSLGTRQKLGIILGLLGHPPLLILDEPLNGLDPMSAYALKRHLQSLTQAQISGVLLATHSLDVAERFITRAILLMDGRIIRQWALPELDAIRQDPARSLEQDMVSTLASA